MKVEQISDLMLEQYMVRELSADSIRAIERLLEESAVLRKRLAELEESNRAISGQYPSGEVAGRIEREYNRQVQSSFVRKERREMPSPKYFLTAAAGVLAVVAFFILAPLEQSSDYVKWLQSPDTTRIKGVESSIYIYKKKGSTVAALKNGSHAREKDRLQIAYVSHRDTYGIIFSIDGRGTVTLQYPNDEKSSTNLVRTKKTSLSTSYELDDAPEFERFFFVTAKHAIDVKKILTSAKSLAADPGAARVNILKLEKSFHQTSFLIVKD